MSCDVLLTLREGAAGRRRNHRRNGFPESVSVMVVGVPGVRPIRRDVASNRAKLLAAADDYLAEFGPPIAFNDLAR